MHEYENDRNYISYGDVLFIRRCPECSRFVKANDSINVNGDGLKDEPNATCKVHGDVQMPFLGFI